jgi:epoxyqueuosine reductase
MPGQAVVNRLPRRALIFLTWAHCMSASSLAARLKERARQLGFELVGIAPAAPADDFPHLEDWLAKGFAGEMAYMHRHGAARQHPDAVLQEVRTVVMLGMNYHAPAMEFPGDRPHGKVARYARGVDYHDVLRAKLNELLAWVQAVVPGTVGRGVVDTAPLLERDFARRAGLGWIGKNTMLIHKRVGSYTMLGALLLDCELVPDAPFEANHCGTCTRCLDACPTDAFAGPYQLDARRCISYLTIELRGPIPEDLRSDLGDWVFGCDICQDVCPWNRKAPQATEPSLLTPLVGPTLDPVELLSLSETAFRERFRETALWRTRRRGLLRNAAIVLGNRGDRRALPALEKALADPEPVVREAAQWAIERIAADRHHGTGRNASQPVEA